MKEFPLRIVPLGGLGEVGKNMMVYEYGEDILIVDTGLMFPANDMLGVDYIIPDFEYIKHKRQNVRGIIITRRDGRNYDSTPAMFDKILLDAPCSAEGAIRKKWTITNQWNLNVIKILSRLQSKLINSAFTALKPGGTLVYSTCTLTPEEDERVISGLIERNSNAKVVPFKVPGLKSRAGVTSWSNETYDSSVKNCIRVYPQDNDTEGFFIAKVVKE